MKCESKANISWQRRSWSYAYEPLIEVCVFLGRPAFIEFSSGFHARRIDRDFFSSRLLLQRRRKTGRKNEENIRRRRISFFLEEKKKEGEGGKDLFKNCQGYWEVSVSVAVSRLLPIFVGFCFWFRRIWSWKKSLRFGFGKFGLGKKYQFLFWRIWSQEKSLDFGFKQLCVGKKKSRYRFRSKFWYCHSVLTSRPASARFLRHIRRH